MLAQALRMIERGGLEGLEHNSADYVHLVTEILKRPAPTASTATAIRFSSMSPIDELLVGRRTSGAPSR